MDFSRRQWLAGAMQLGAWTAIQSAIPPFPPLRAETDSSPVVFPQPAPGIEIWDAHVHLGGGNLQGTIGERVRLLLKYADRMGIRRLILCMGPKFEADPSPEQLREQNNAVLEALQVAPDRLLSFVYLNPKHLEASLQEIERCVVHGPMVGIKLWIAIRCSEPPLDPLMRRAEELRLPVLQHTFFRQGGNLPGESSPEDLVQLAARHPKVKFICAHTGADWERGIRAVRPQKNIWIDISGSDPTSGFVEMATRELGSDRIIFGTDAPIRSFASQLAKVLAARLTPEAQKAIFRDNIGRLLEPILARKLAPSPASS
ncbi:MAG: amidohydrolase family protein [Thermoguttaceae bacterium]|nr:amidohydrolase family protein [Thermoguttaceae bacterium]MDW8038546.1 amidohydrolase family protein [Thermoguttaceae bacterium]